MKTQEEREHGSLKSYLIGFTLSLLLTLAAYFAVVKQIAAGSVLILILLGLGLIQTVVQLIVFLHLGGESKPRWNLATFLFMGLVLVIFVFGSMWIMYNLNYRMM